MGYTNERGYEQGIYAFAEILTDSPHLENAPYDRLNRENVIDTKITHLSKD